MAAQNANGQNATGMLAFLRRHAAVWTRLLQYRNLSALPFDILEYRTVNSTTQPLLESNALILVVEKALSTLKHFGVQLNCVFSKQKNS